MDVYTGLVGPLCFATLSDLLLSDSLIHYTKPFSLEDSQDYDCISVYFFQVFPVECPLLDC